MSNNGFQKGDQVFTVFVLERQIVSHESGILVWEATNIQSEALCLLLFLPRALKFHTGSHDNLKKWMRGCATFLEENSFIRALQLKGFHKSGEFAFELATKEEAGTLENLNETDIDLGEDIIQHIYSVHQTGRAQGYFDFDLIFKDESRGVWLFPPGLVSTILNELEFCDPANQFLQAEESRLELTQGSDRTFLNSTMTQLGRELPSASSDLSNLEQFREDESQPILENEFNDRLDSRILRKRVVLGVAFGVCLVILVALFFQKPHRDEQPKGLPSQYANAEIDSDWFEPSLPVLDMDGFGQGTGQFESNPIPSGDSTPIEPQELAQNERIESAPLDQVVNNIEPRVDRGISQPIKKETESTSLDQVVNNIEPRVDRGISQPIKKETESTSLDQVVNNSEPRVDRGISQPIKKETESTPLDQVVNNSEPRVDRGISQPIKKGTESTPLDQVVNNSEPRVDRGISQPIKKGAESTPLDQVVNNSEPRVDREISQPIKKGTDNEQDSEENSPSLAQADKSSKKVPADKALVSTGGLPPKDDQHSGRTVEDQKVAARPGKKASPEVASVNSVNALVESESPEKRTAKITTESKFPISISKAKSNSEKEAVYSKASGQIDAEPDSIDIESEAESIVELIRIHGIESEAGVIVGYSKTAVTFTLWVEIMDASEGAESDFVIVTKSEATRFLEQLTEKHQNSGVIKRDMSYRLAPRSHMKTQELLCAEDSDRVRKPFAFILISATGESESAVRKSVERKDKPLWKRP